MHNKHNFFILDIDCLTNLKGLLSYLAERIHLGNLCLQCSKQFRSAQRCQQHMIDCRHCVMNDADEAEYAPYYDYARQYENMGLLPKLEAPKEEEKNEKGAEGEDGWEDLEDADLESVEDEVVDHNDLEVVVEEASSKSSVKEESSDIAAVDKTDTPNKSVIDQIGNTEESSIAESKEDTPSIGSFNLNAVLKRRQVKGGMTRMEAYKALQIEKPTILSTGEIKLANGKIIGHRDYQHIYRQRYYRTEDSREAVIINRLALQYRQKKGGPLALCN